MFGNCWATEFSTSFVVIYRKAWVAFLEIRVLPLGTAVHSHLKCPGSLEVINAPSVWKVWTVVTTESTDVKT